MITRCRGTLLPAGRARPKLHPQGLAFVASIVFAAAFVIVRAFLGDLRPSYFGQVWGFCVFWGVSYTAMSLWIQNGFPPRLADARKKIGSLPTERLVRGPFSLHGLPLSFHDRRLADGARVFANFTSTRGGTDDPA